MELTNTCSINVYNKVRLGKSFPQFVSICRSSMLLIAMIAGITFSAFAQLSISQNATLSFTGLHVSTQLQFRKGNFGFQAGPKLLISESATLSGGPWGIDAGISYYLPS